MAKDKKLALGVFSNGMDLFTYSTEVDPKLSEKEIVDLLCEEARTSKEYLSDMFIVVGNFAFCNVDLDI